MMVRAAKIMVIIQNLMVIFDSCTAPLGFLNTYRHSGSSCESCVLKLSCMGVRLKMRCFTPLRLPNL